MDTNTFNNRLNRAKLPVVIDVWAGWCMPCKMIEPALHRLGEQYAGQVEVWKINADENQELLHRLGISGIPTLIAFRQGKEIRRTVGAQPQSSLERLFKAALGEENTQEAGLSLNNRLLRLALSLILVILGWPVAHSLILVSLGGIVLFSAVYDRCPIYQAIAPRITAAFRNLFT